MFCWDDSTSIQSEDKLDLIFELASDYNMTPVSVPPAMPLTKVNHFETDFGSSFSFFFVVRFTSCSTFYDRVRFTSNSKHDWLVQLWKKNWFGIHFCGLAINKIAVLSIVLKKIGIIMSNFLFPILVLALQSQVALCNVVPVELEIIKDLIWGRCS